MGKKRLVGLSLSGVLCLFAIVLWSNSLLSPRQQKHQKNETVTSSQVPDIAEAPSETGGTLSNDATTTADAAATADASQTEDEDSKSPKPEETADTENSSAQNKTNPSGTDNNPKRNTGSEKKNGGGKATGSKNGGKNNNGKDDKNSSFSSNNNSDDSGGDKSDNSGGNNPDNAKPAQNTPTPANKTHKSVVDGLTITSEQAACNVSGNTATIHKAGTYTLSGKLSNGQVIVDTEKTSKVTIICNSMSLNCSNSAPLYVKSADEVTLQLAAGTSNSITDASSYVFSSSVKEPDAACYSEDDLTIEGTGSLSVTGKYQDGIACKNDIVIKQGTIHVNAADDGIRGKDGIEIRDGSVNVTCEAHALKTTETSQSNKGLVEISGGSVHLDAVGDGIHATNQIKASGGSTYIDAKNDGLDTDSSFVMTGGTMVIDGPKSSNHGIFDCTKGTTISGGTFFAVGSSAMAKRPGTSGSQKALFYKANAEQNADTTVRVENQSGTTVYQHKTTRKYQAVIYSAPNLAKGTYSIYCNSSKLGTCKIDA